MSKVVAQDIISLWQSIQDVSERQRALDELNMLAEAAELEKEIHADSDQNGDYINSIVGNDTDPSWHCYCAGDFLSPEVTEKVAAKGPIQLVFTSPPYNAGIQYDNYEDNKEFLDYVEFLNHTWSTVDEVLAPGGRLVINLRDITVAKGERVPIVVPIHMYLSGILNYKYRGTHIWYKGREESSFAWGSWLSSNNPSIIDLYEYVFVFQKQGAHENGEDNMDKTEFIESVLGIWKIRPVKKIIGKKKQNKLNHPCPFPIELAKRVIKLYSHVGDTVLDPFAGVMSTAIAASDCGRNSISVDISPAYCKAGIERFSAYTDFRFDTNLTLESL